MASIAMFGNTNQPVEVMVRSSHLFMPMPDVIREDMAFLDRIHCYLPAGKSRRCGWSFSPITTDSWSIILPRPCGNFAGTTYTEIVDRHFSLGDHLNARDVKAVRKTVSGLVKLIYPDGDVTKDEMAELLSLPWKAGAG